MDLIFTFIAKAFRFLLAARTNLPMKRISKEGGVPGFVNREDSSHI